MKKLIKYIGSYKKEAVLAPLFKLLEATFDLLVPLVIAAMIENGIGVGGDAGKSYIIKMGLVLLGLGIFGLLFSVVAQYFAARAAVGFTADMKGDLFEHMQKFSFAQMDSFGTSTMITRMTVDANQVQNGVNMFLRLSLRSPFIVFGAMVLAFTINTWAGWFFAGTIAILMVIVFALIFITVPVAKKVQGKMDRVTSLTRENLSGVRVLRAFTREDKEKEEFALRQKGLVSTQLKAGTITSLMNPLTYAIINLALGLFLYQCRDLVNTDVLTVANVVALVNLMGQILVELIKFANFCITVTKAIASGNRIQKVFDMEPVKNDGELKEFADGANDAFVRFEDVCFEYADAGEEALSHISFSCKKGDTVGIIGGTGSGKSTLVALLAGYYPAKSGTVSVAGQPIGAYDAQFLRGKIRVALQKPVLFAGTVRSNLLMGKEDATEEEMKAALSIAQCGFLNKNGEDSDSFAPDLDREVEQGGKNFSGGQRQRINLARAIIGNPDILVLDDSSSALDYATDAKLRRELAKLHGKTTIVIISQRTSVVEHSDRILVMDDGGLSAVGSHEELLSNCELYREIHETQKQAREGGITA